LLLQDVFLQPAAWQSREAPSAALLLELSTFWHSDRLFLALCVVPGMAEARSQLPLLCIAAGALRHLSLGLGQLPADAILLAEPGQRTSPLVSLNVYQPKMCS